MTSLRRVPPAHSPVPPSALAAGLSAVIRPDPGLRDRMAARVARRYGARTVVFTDSGTSALALALAAAAREREEGGRRVALPAFGCYDLLTAARAAGVEPVLYDLEPRTLSPEPASLRQALERGAGAVVAAPLYGVPVDLDAVEELAAEAGATLVEDAAQGVGGAYRGRPLGAFGSLSVLSFGRGKGLSGGGGGALLVHDEAGEEAVAAAGAQLGAPNRGFRPLLAAGGQWALGRPGLYGLPAALPFLGLGETVYRPPRPPAGIPPACLAVLERSWEPSLREAGRRRRQAGRLLRRVRSAADLRAVDPPHGGRPGYLRLPVLAPRASGRNRLASRPARRAGIMPSYPRPLYRLEAFRDGPGVGPEPETGLAGAEALARQLYTLPVHGRMSPGDVDRVERCVGTAGG